MLNVTDVVTEYGAYYQDRGQRVADLYKKLTTMMVTWALFQTVMRDDSIYEAGIAEVGELLQPFQKSWTPKGIATFRPQVIRAHKAKVDYELYPDDIEATWLGFLADNGLNRKDWPIVRYIQEELLTPRLADDIETKAMYHGVYVAPTAGVAGPASASMDGFRKIINDGVTAGTIAPITMGAIPANDVDFVTYVEDFVQQILVRYRNQQMPLIMNEDLAFRYKNGFHQKYNVNYSQDPQDMRVRHRSNIRIVESPAMVGSDKIVMTPQTNMKKLVRRTQNIGRWGIEQEDRRVKMWTDFYLGLGFVIHEIVFTTDVDLV